MLILSLDISARHEHDSRIWRHILRNEGTICCWSIFWNAYLDHLILPEYLIPQRTSHSTPHLFLPRNDLILPASYFTPHIAFCHTSHSISHLIPPHISFHPTSHSNSHLILPRISFYHTSVASNIWNALPSHLSSIPTLPVFRRALKHRSSFTACLPWQYSAKSGKIKPAQCITLWFSANYCHHTDRKYHAAHLKAFHPLIKPMHLA